MRSLPWEEQYWRAGWVLSGKTRFRRMPCPTPLQERRRCLRFFARSVYFETDFPAVLRVSARSEEGEVMALEHQYYSVFGVQFHPESILTPAGSVLLQRFLTLHSRA